jgi:molecular chaperone DnaJ
MVKSHYTVLGVEPDASPQQIKSAYRQRVKELHPDHYGQDSGPFLAVQEAYDVLSDPARRRRYDEQLTGQQRRRQKPQAASQQPGAPGRAPVEPLRPAGRSAPTVPGRRFRSPVEDLSGAFETIFDGVWSDMAGQPYRQERVQFEVRLTPELARRGGRLRLLAPLAVECPACGGWGAAGFYECWECLGTGYINVDYPLFITIPAGVSDGEIVRIPLEQWAGGGAVLTVRFRVQ